MNEQLLQEAACALLYLLPQEVNEKTFNPYRVSVESKKVDLAVDDPTLRTREGFVTY